MKLEARIQMPQEVKVAIALMSLVLVGGLALNAVAGAPDLPRFEQGHFMLWAIKAGGFAIGAALLVYLARGYGWIRWWYVISLGLALLGYAVIALGWMASEGEAKLRMSFSLFTLFPFLGNL